jgi:predicted acyltransferase
LYWFLLFFFAVPGLDPFGAEGSAVLRLDRWLFGTNHLYLEQVRPGVRIPFDPEGLLSTLPAVVTVLLGWFAGLLATGRARPMDLVARDLLLFGIIAVGGGLVWDLFFPINKKIWSSSYVVFSGGFSMILFGLSVWVLDVLRWRNGVVFFTSIGTNALFAYLMSELIIRVVRAVPVHGSVVVGVDNLYQWFYHYFFMWGEPNPLSSLSFALVYMLFCWVICWVLFNRKIVIKL